MRKLISAVLILAALVGLGAGAPAAQAAGPSCSIHQLDITSWSIQTDEVNTYWHFKCGAGWSAEWYLLLQLQWRDNSGSWHTFDCADGGKCETYKPGLYSDGTAMTYHPGEEHSGNSHFNTAGNIDCKSIRFHARQVFVGIEVDTYNSGTRNIGGC